MGIKQVWYSSNADLRSPDTIHQILAYGGLTDIQALRQALGQDTVKKLFLRHPKKIYTKTSLNFTKNFILGIRTPIDEHKYLKSTSRSVR